MSARRTMLALATVALSLLLIGPQAIVAQDGTDASPAAATPQPSATPAPPAATPEPAAPTDGPAPTDGAVTATDDPATDGPVTATDDPTAAPDPDVDAATSVLPDLAPRSPTRSAVEICDAASGRLEDGTCFLDRAPRGDAPASGILGDDLEVTLLDVGSRPTDASGAPLTDTTGVEAIGWIDRIKPSRNERDAIERARKRAGVINGEKNGWNNVGVIDMPLPWGEDEVDDWLLRITSPGGILDIGRVGNKDRVTDQRGRRSAGLGFVGGEQLTFVVPGGLASRFMLDLAWIDPSGRTVVQHLGGPGSPDALIPRRGDFDPLLDCGTYIASIDFESSTDGQAYDLHQLDLVLATNMFPPDIDPAAFRFDLTLEPNGARARRADPVTFEGIEPTVVRGAIAITLDLRPEMLSGATGYRLFQQPFVIESIESSIDPSALPVDPEQAVALLEEAGWADTDEDGILEASHADLASEFSRLAGSEWTFDPLTWGDRNCARSAMDLAAADACGIPRSQISLERWEAMFGETVGELDLREGFFPGDLFGCTILGPDEQLLGIFATSPRYGVDETLAPDALGWTTQLDCVIDESALADLTEGPVQVADCETADYSLWADTGFGGLSYVLLPGRDEEDESVGQLMRTFDSVDLDGDGIADRHDVDLDGDGTPDLDDDDDDADGVVDWLDANERDARVTVSPARTATAAALDDVLRGE